MTQLLAASPSDRPRILAIGTIVALAPTLLIRDGRRMWPLFLCCAAVGVALVALLGGPSPSYAGAAALAAVYALCLGGMGVVLGFFSGFASSSRQMGLVVFGVVLPMLASAAVAVLVAIMSAAAAGRAAGVGSGARTVAIALTAFLLLGPAAVMVLNGGAILRSRVWRENPKLLLGVLAALPRMTVPLLRRIALPLALLWAVVWLLARLG
jgi:hypothetical protein